MLKILIPLFNELSNIDFLIKQIKQSIKVNHKIYFCDDGSSDGSWEEIIKQKSLYPQGYINAFKLFRNFGKDNAILCLLENINHNDNDYGVIIDSDLQHPIEEIDNIYKKITENNYSMLVGFRIDKNRSLFRKLISKFFNFLFVKHSFDSKNTNSLSDFSIFKISDIKRNLKYHQNKFIYKIFILNSSFSKSSFDYFVKKRFDGESKFQPLKLYDYFLEYITVYSFKPLKYILHFSVILILITSIIFIFTLFFKISGVVLITNQGLLFSFSLFMLSIIMFVLGLISYYLANLSSLLTNQKYVISEKLIDNE